MLTRRIRALWLVVALFVSSCATWRPFDVAQDNFDLGLSSFNQGNFRDAARYFERATEQNPKFAAAYLYLGRSYVSMRRWRDAIQPLRTALRLSPEETQREIVDLLLDAGFAAGLDALGPDRPASSSQRFKDSF